MKTNVVMISICLEVALVAGLFGYSILGYSSLAALIPVLMLGCCVLPMLMMGKNRGSHSCCKHETPEGGAKHPGEK